MLPLVRTILENLVQSTRPSGKVGRPHSDTDDVLTCIDLVLRTGMPWRYLQHTKCVTHWSTAHRLFRKWTDEKLFEIAYKKLLKLRKRRPRRYCIDSSFVKNQYGIDCLGRNPTDRGRKATKMSAIVDDEGVPISIVYFPANTSDFCTVEQTLEECMVTLQKGIPLYADKGYDSEKNRELLQKRGLIDRIAKRKTRTHRVVNAKRTIVENFFAFHDKCRRLIMRFDALIASYASFTFIFACDLIVKRL